MLAALQRHWFLTSLAAIIGVGMWLGANGYSADVRPIVAVLNPRYVTMLVTFLMAYSLDSQRLGHSFRSPGPVVLGCVLNYGVLPLLAWGLSRGQLHTDFRVGLMIAGSVPCTLVAASVMTRKAGGNDAVSLLTTIATNLSCFAVAPFWLWLALDQRVEMDVQQVMRDLLVAVLIPTILGQLVRQPGRMLQLAIRYKTPIGVVGQVMIELLVFSAALRAGESWSESQELAVRQEQLETGTNQGETSPRGTHRSETKQSETNRTESNSSGQGTRSDPPADPPATVRTEGVSPAPSPAASTPPLATRREPISLGALLVVWLSSLSIHVAGLTAGYWISGGLGFSRMDAIAVAFAGSQKTLPVGLYLATTPTIFGDAYPFALLPMLLYHTTQLFLDTLVASRWSQVKAEPAP